MIGLRIGAAELAAIEAGTPAVVLAPGVALPDPHPLLTLALDAGVLRRTGETDGRSLPLPPGTRLMALIGPDSEAERLRPMLPAGLPVLPDATALPALLAEALCEALAARDAADADRDRLRRALGTLAPRRPQLAIDAPPVAGTGTAMPVSQPLGRDAAGLCTVEIHLATAGTGGLRARLLAGARVLGTWHLPEGALAPGWLALDLPEPAAAAEPALLELTAEATATPPLLSLGGDGTPASIALRVWIAGPGWSVLPRYFEWAARGATRPALPLPIPLAEATAEGARVELVAIGEDPPRLMLEIPPASEASLRLPSVPIGACDLLRAVLRLRGAAGSGMQAALCVAGDAVETATEWRELTMTEGTGFELPLPAGPMARVRIALRNGGDAAALVEVASLTLAAGASGEPRRPPPAEPPAGRSSVAVPVGMALPAWRNAPPAPQLLPAGPGGMPAGSTRPTKAASTGTALRVPVIAPGATGFQEFRLNQHLDSANATYRHIDIGLGGLVSAAGRWRQIRLKLFERRGVAGLEFRQAKGWPPMFDAWPKGGSDPHGPFWRLETEGTAHAMAALTTPHDRALIVALLEVLPEVATRAAQASKLDAAEAEGWIARARRIAQAVAGCSGIRAAG